MRFAARIAVRWWSSKHRHRVPEYLARAELRPPFESHCLRRSSFDRITHGMHGAAHLVHRSCERSLLEVLEASPTRWVASCEVGHVGC